MGWGSAPDRHDVDHVDAVVGAPDVVDALDDLADAEAFDLRDHRAEHRLELQTRQPLARARVGAVAEGEMVDGVAGDVETLRVVIASRVSIAGGEQQCDLRTGRNHGAADFDVFGDESADEGQRGGEAQHLGERRGNERWVLPQGPVLVGVLSEQDHGVAERRDGRLHTGHDDLLGENGSRLHRDIPALGRLKDRPPEAALDEIGGLQTAAGPGEELAEERDAGRPALTEENVLDMLRTRPHVLYDTGEGQPFGEQVLQSHGITADVRVRVSDSMVLADLVAGGPFVAVHLEQLVRSLPADTPLTWVPLPFDTGASAMDVVWSPWLSDLEFRTWFRELLRSCAPGERPIPSE